MKKEIEKILFDYGKFVIKNYDAYREAIPKPREKEYHRKYIAEALTERRNDYLNDLLSLLSSKIAECEDEIRDLIYDDETCQADTIAKYIITLIQNKIKE